MASEWRPSIAEPTGQSSLRRFRGRLQDISRIDREYEGRKYVNIQFTFTDVDVIESVEPYLFPVAKITIRYADPATSRGRTRWGAFSASARKFLGPEGNIEQLVGKMQEWAQLPAELRMRNEEGEWENTTAETWQIVAVDGLGSAADMRASLDEHVLSLLDGKTEKDFYQVFYVDPKVREHPELIQEATERKLLARLVSAGLVEQTPEGVYKRKTPGS